MSQVVQGCSSQFVGGVVKTLRNLVKRVRSVRKVVGLNSRGNTKLPGYLQAAHDLCFMNHDVLVELLRRGEEGGSFEQTIAVRGEDEVRSLEAASDVFAWLDARRSADEQAQLIRRTVFPAVLSDFLHFVYETLETSRKGKLTVSYALIRKPLQDALFVFETMAVDLNDFVGRLRANPEALDSKKAGGTDAHAERIDRVLRLLGEGDRFDAGYLARLRYDKSSGDGFEHYVNKALHLFTGHPALRTEPLNINFVFSDWDANLTQWYYLYSRLPYLLFYARRLIEHLFATFETRTDPRYLADVERRIEAATLLWAPNVDEQFRTAEITRFVDRSRERLFAELSGLGVRAPTVKDLVRIRDSGEIQR